MGCKPTISSALLFINNIFIYLFQRNRASNWGWVNSFEAAALNGQVATTVSMLEMDLTPAHFKGLSLHVVFMLIPMLHNHKREQHGEILTKLAEIAYQRTHFQIVAGYIYSTIDCDIVCTTTCCLLAFTVIY